MGWRVQVVGGGVIGLACAWELSRNGHEVTVVAPAPGRDGASWVAAGMLAPVTEAHFGESALTALLVEGAGHWPAFAAALEAATGLAIGYDTTGTVTVALDASDRASLDDLLAYQHTLGLEAYRRSASECRRLVPALSPALRGGLEVPGDHQVDNRALLGCLAPGLRKWRGDVRRGPGGGGGEWTRPRPGRRPPPRLGPHRPGGRNGPAFHRRPGRGRSPPAPPRQGAHPAARAAGRHVARPPVGAHGARPGARALGVPRAPTRRLGRGRGDSRGTGQRHRGAGGGRARAAE